MKVDELKQRYQLFLKKHVLTPEEAVVGAGGALCVLGLRDQTSDIDLDVPSSVFKRLLGMGFPTHVFNGNVLVIEADEFIDVHLKVSTDPVVITEGVAHYSPQSVLAFKKRLNREKDQADIKALETYLS